MLSKPEHNQSGGKQEPSPFTLTIILDQSSQRKHSRDPGLPHTPVLPVLRTTIHTHAYTHTRTHTDQKHRPTHQPCLLHSLRSANIHPGTFHPRRRPQPPVLRRRRLLLRRRQGRGPSGATPAHGGRRQRSGPRGSRRAPAGRPPPWRWAEPPPPPPSRLPPAGRPPPASRPPPPSAAAGRLPPRSPRLLPVPLRRSLQRRKCAKDVSVCVWGERAAAAAAPAVRVCLCVCLSVESFACWGSSAAVTSREPQRGSRSPGWACRSSTPAGRLSAGDTARPGPTPPPPPPPPHRIK